MTEGGYWGEESRDAGPPPEYFTSSHPGTRPPAGPARRRLGPRALFIAVGVLVVIGASIAIALASETSPYAPPPVAAASSSPPEQTARARVPIDPPTAEPPLVAPSPTDEPTAAASPTVAPTPSTAPAPTALEAALGLTVGPQDPWNEYSRDYFGPAWADVDRNGCDQRNDVLARDLRDVVFRPGTDDCIVSTGTFSDPYSGSTVPFVRGQGTSELVQIDHVVALADAWRKGAEYWDSTQRQVFANDPLNLLAADGALNQAKSASDASEWLPPNHAFHCAYVARQVAVKTKYGLRVTDEELTAIVEVLEGCPDEPLPAAQ